MKTTEELLAWLQIRINYWEEECSKHKGVPPIRKCVCDFEEGMEKGVLDGLYQVMEFITAQK